VRRIELQEAPLDTAALVKTVGTKEDGAVLTFIGTMAQHVTGSLLTASLYSGVIAKQGALAYWSAVFYLYPVERLVIVAASTFIGVAVFKAMRRTTLRDVLNA